MAKLPSRILVATASDGATWNARCTRVADLASPPLSGGKLASKCRAMASRHGLLDTDDMSMAKGWAAAPCSPAYLVSKSRMRLVNCSARWLSRSRTALRISYWTN